MAEPISSIKILLSVAKNLQELKQYVHGGDIASLIIDSELSAAKEAFIKAKTASNPVNQIWSAINHLEAAFERIKLLNNHKQAYIRIASMIDKGVLISKGKWLLCVMAIAYYSVDVRSPRNLEQPA